MISPKAIRPFVPVVGFDSYYHVPISDVHILSITTSALDYEPETHRSSLNLDLGKRIATAATLKAKAKPLANTKYYRRTSAGPAKILASALVFPAGTRDLRHGGKPQHSDLMKPLDDNFKQQSGFCVQIRGGSNPSLSI